MRHRSFVHRCLNVWLVTLVAGLCAYAPSWGAASFWQEGRHEPLTQQPAVPAFVELAKLLNPAVVNISTKQEIQQPEEGGSDPFQDFFDRFFGPRDRRRRPGQGSGFIINAEGYIVTNYHVVEGASDIQVTLATKDQFDAKLIGGDAKTDLALLRIETDKPLPTVPVGDSDALEVGEWVMAIGNPFGLGHTVTTGIVSAKSRIINAGPYDDFIQTDASINPGNSGGPLFNMRGEVIGINTAIVPQGQGIGFAIPSNMAKAILLELRGAGKVTRGWLGVAIQELSPELMQAFKLEDKQGALVAQVLPDSPAEKAGLQQGDIIVGFDGKPVQESSELPRLVAAMEPNTSVSMDIIRNGERRSISVVLGTMKDDDSVAAASQMQPSDVESALGLRVRQLTPEIAQRLELEDTRGVVVAEIDPNGPASEAGLRRGDVIREVDRTEITDISDYDNATAKLDPQKNVLLLVERRGNNLYIALKPERAG
jgi:serine protease Do